MLTRIVLIGLLLFPAALRAQSTAPRGLRGELEGERADELPGTGEGAFAPPGRWAFSGGTPARSGWSLSRSLRTQPIEAWRIQAAGEIESEPLVWDGRIVLALKERGGQRGLQVVELSSGRTLTHHRFPAREPLEPSLWKDRIAVRQDARRVSIYRMAGQRLLTGRQFVATRSISPPILFDDHVYLRQDESLVCYDLHENEPVWKVKGSFRGTPAIRDGRIYALRYDARGEARLQAHDRGSGNRVSDILAGHHDGKRPALGDDARIALHARNAFVQFPLPVSSSHTGDYRFARFERDLRGRLTTSNSLHELALLPLQAGPDPASGDWIGLDVDDDARRWISTRDDGPRMRMLILSDRQNHPELVDLTVPASRTHDVVYLGRLAFDATTMDVLWKRPTPFRKRPVPVDGALLVVEGERDLVCLRESAPDRGAEARAVAELASDLEATVAEGYASLAQSALRLGDASLVGRLLNEAVQRGARGPTLESAQVGYERLSRSRSVRLDARRSRAILEEEAALLAKPLAELSTRAAATAEPLWNLAYLRAALDRDPAHGPSVAAVRAALDESAPLTSPFEALSWLDFLDVNARAPVRFLSGTEADKEAGPSERKALRREKRRWNATLSGYRSDRLFVIAAPGRPGSVARCLEVGELVCDLLEEIFRSEAPVGTRPPLTLLLYGSQEEYIEQSRHGGSPPEIGLGWTAGHYSPVDNLSRMFVPDGDSELRELLGVYAHELTHHWLSTRSPFRPTPRSGSVDLPGYWIAEGFATLVEEFRLDPRGGTWAPDNPRASSLDTIANTEPIQLLPWELVLGASYREFSRLDPEPHASVHLSWRLGVRAQKSQIHFFYAQAGALAHYLYRSSPQTEEALREYVRAYYEGRPGGLDLPAALGLSAEELGAEVVNFARREMRNPE